MISGRKTPDYDPRHSHDVVHDERPRDVVITASCKEQQLQMARCMTSEIVCVTYEVCEVSVV